MSMRIAFLKDHDGHKANKDYFIERTLACRLCENGIALPYSTYKESIMMAKEVALKEKAAAEEKKKAELIKKREDAEIETAISQKAKKREKTKTKINR